MVELSLGLYATKRELHKLRAIAGDLVDLNGGAA